MTKQNKNKDSAKKSRTKLLSWWVITPVLLTAWIVSLGVFSQTKPKVMDINEKFVDQSELMFRPRRLLSQTTYLLTRIYIPKFFRSSMYTAFGKAYGLIFDDIQDELTSFTNFNKFFTREVKKRDIPNTDDTLVSPADSLLLSMEKVTGNDVILAKEVRYSLANFLTGEFKSAYNAEEVEGLKRRKDTDLYSFVFYLSPGDYHRYHSMAKSTLHKRVHVAGELYTVKDTFVGTYTGVYEVNERLVLDGEWKYGRIFQAYVSATNVGTMTLNFDPDLTTNQWGFGKIINDKKLDNIRINAGQEIGRFNMGSTVVAVVEVPKNYKFSVKVGEKVRYGQSLGSVSN